MVATKDVRITRIFDAPREKVWQAWTDPAHIKKWWGPEGFTCPDAIIDLRVGGTFRYCMRGPKGTDWDKDMWSGGVFKEIVPLEKIVASDNFMDAEGNVVSPKDFGMPGEWPDEEMIVTFTFEDAGEGKTKLTLVHQGHPADMADNAKDGWTTSLDKLARVLGA